MPGCMCMSVILSKVRNQRKPARPVLEPHLEVGHRIYDCRRCHTGTSSTAKADSKQQQEPRVSARPGSALGFPKSNGAGGANSGVPRARALSAHDRQAHPAHLARTASSSQLLNAPPTVAMLGRQQPLATGAGGRSLQLPPNPLNLPGSNGQDVTRNTS
eukprot:366399-Chlamydomonas_euryale.AAC.40